MQVALIKTKIVSYVRFYCVLICFVLVLFLPLVLFANEEIEALKNQIDERNNKLRSIEQEIAGYQRELQKVGSEKTSLQQTINQLELERKKVQADISYTQNKIGATDLEINKLTLEIRTTEEEIGLNKDAITKTLQSLHAFENQSFVEVLLTHKNVSAFWNELDTLAQIREAINDEVRSLVSQKVLLSERYVETQQKRSDLVDLKIQYADQNEVLVTNKNEKSELLVATKNEEAEYQKLLREKERAKEQLLKELRDFESKLQFILDPNTIPQKGIPIFAWPVENVIITQYFGGTEFAKQNASVYGGRAYHPGIDFGVPRGTKILAPLSGTVRATGDTDVVKGCYSWGKWTLIDHANGLSTLYAHQSVIGVTAGQKVKTGEVIGYSGNTGYSTGPHLHFTVYAKAGVHVRRFNEIKAVTSCGAATTPIAATDAYIDPLNYLPKR